MPALIKKSGKFYVRVRAGGTDRLIPTGETRKSPAMERAARVELELQRAKLKETLPQILIAYAYQKAEKELTARAKSERDNAEFPALMHTLKAKAALEALPLLDLLAPEPPLTAREVWERYVELKRGEVKDVTLKTKEGRVAAFIRWARGLDMRDITEEDARRFLSTLTVKDQTHNNYVSDLSSVFKTIPELPNVWTANLRKVVDDSTETPPIAIDTIRQILAFCDANPEKTSRTIPLSRWAVFLRTSYYSGLRPVDVQSLTVAEVASNAIDLMPEKTSRTRKRISFVPDEKLIALLQNNPAGSDGLYFPEFHNLYKRHRSYLGKGFQQICKLAGLPELQLYGFRHTFVTYQLDAGEEDTAVAAAVGHTSTATTKGHYYHGRQKVELSAMPEI